MKIKSIKRIKPEISRCIEVAAEDRLFSLGGENGDAVLTHNSVVQRNIVFGCIMRPDFWTFAGIDLKRVELSWLRNYSHVVLGVGTELDVAVEILRLASQIMMKRYDDMEKMQVNDFKDIPGNNKYFLVMIDEAGELLGQAKGQGEEIKIQNALKGEAQQLIGSIARLGRAAGVHLLVATQRPDAELIPGETRNNLHYRINCGPTGSTASSMILDGSTEGMKVKSNPRGRLYLRIHRRGNHGQGFFANQDWLDKWLESQGLRQDGTPIPGWSPPVSDSTEGDSENLPKNEEKIKVSQNESKESTSTQVEPPTQQRLPVEEVGDWSKTFKKKDESEDKYSRPEDSWDSELEAAIALNNNRQQ